MFNTAFYHLEFFDLPFNGCKLFSQGKNRIIDRVAFHVHFDFFNEKPIFFMMQIVSR